MLSNIDLLPNGFTPAGENSLAGVHPWTLCNHALRRSKQFAPNAGRPQKSTPGRSSYLGKIFARSSGSTCSRRSEQRRAGKGLVSACRFRLSPDPSKKKKKHIIDDYK